MVYTCSNNDNIHVHVHLICGARAVPSLVAVDHQDTELLSSCVGEVGVPGPDDVTQGVRKPGQRKYSTLILRLES